MTAAMRSHPAVEKYTHKIDAFMQKYPSVSFYDKFKEIESTTGYPAAWFFVLAVTIVTGVIALVGGSKLLTDLVGFLYPAYMSFKSMESGGVGSSSAATDDVQWLTYWVAFSFLNILETFIGPVLSAIIPMYGFLKMGILVWMWYPSTRGAQTIYEQALRPLLLPYIETSTTTSSSKKE